MRTGRHAHPRLDPRHPRHSVRGVKLYTCYGTFKSRKPDGHPCRNAYLALKEAGYEPKIVRTFGCVLNPAFPGRREVRELTGNYQVPPSFWTTEP